MNQIFKIFKPARCKSNTTNFHYR